MKSIRQKRKAVGRKSLFRRFVYLYRLTVVNEDEQRRVFRMKISHFILTTTVLVIALLGAWIGIEIYRNSPKQRGTSLEDYRIRQAIVNEALRIDSLEQVFEMQNRYITTLQDIIAGTIRIDTVYSVDSLARQRSELLMERTEREENFVRQYLGVDIVASPNQSVVSVLDGTVLMANYTSDMGYTICVVHPGELISVYKHCESLLKKAGDRVKQGDVVALVGSMTGNSLQSSHLHFELWYQGQPLDPEKYILFQ